MQMAMLEMGAEVKPLRGEHGQSDASSEAVA